MQFIWNRPKGGRDIELPAEGKRDPRLPKKAATLKDLGASLKGLQDVLGEQAREVSKRNRKY